MKTNLLCKAIPRLIEGLLLWWFTSGNHCLIRQRNLVRRAAELGWFAEQIQVVDEDQGVTAWRSSNRFGFEEMMAIPLGLFVGEP